MQKIRWEGTQADTNRMQKEFSKTSTDVEVVEFDVPTDKPNLLLFLNEYVSGELSVEQSAALLRQIGMKVLPNPNF